MSRNAEIYHLVRQVEQLNNVVNELLIENNDLKEQILEDYDNDVIRVAKNQEYYER